MFSGRNVIDLLRYALAVVFVWFGVLKMFNVSPSMEMLKNALPGGLGELQIILFSIAFLEILIGIGLFLKRTYKFTSIVMIVLLLIQTIAVVITQGFDPRFPILSLAGEYALKNIVLISAGMILLVKDEKTEEIKSEKQNKNDS